MNNNHRQVWQWNTLQRSSDVFMNKAYILAAGRLVEKALSLSHSSKNILDVGAGSGLILKHLSKKAKKDFLYTGVDINSDGLKMLIKRAENLNCKEKVTTFVDDITVKNELFIGKFDMIFSNFCLYTISNSNKRQEALKNITNYLQKTGTFHISLPSENYSASNISFQCLKDELNDEQNLFLKSIRSTLLVPYQWQFVLKPIEQKANEGIFIRFNPTQIENEFKAAGLSINYITLDYGGCGYHIHGSKI